MTRTVLFLCTGNYFRSRYAEIYFNHLNQDVACSWQADSRGLALERLHPAAGLISPYTLQRLEDRGIATSASDRQPMPLLQRELEDAGLVVALKAAEHRPMLLDRFPSWVDRVEYWTVDDIDYVPPGHALDLIEEQVELLLERLAK